MDSKEIKEILKLRVFCMDNSACALANARRRAQDETYDREYWKGRVKFWERLLTDDINRVRFTYNLYLKS